MDETRRPMVYNHPVCSWLSRTYGKTTLEENHAMSTAYLFSAVIYIGLAYLIGILFKGFNPLKLIAGLAFAIVTIPPLIQEKDPLYFAAFLLGFCYAFGNPIKWLFTLIQEVSLSLQLAKARKLAQEQEYIHQTREDLHRQAEELQRQKAETQSDILKQQQKAQEQIRQERERLQKEREELQREIEKQKGSPKGSLNPKSLADAYKILGVPNGASLDECKKAYRHLCALFHPDKFARFEGILKQQAEESLKLVNAAWDTINGKL